MDGGTGAVRGENAMTRRVWVCLCIMDDLSTLLYLLYHLFPRRVFFLSFSLFASTQLLDDSHSSSTL